MCMFKSRARAACFTYIFKFFTVVLIEKGSIKLQELERIWKKVAEELSKEVSAVSYDSWIKPITPEGIDETKITLKVPFSVNKNMIMTKYFSLIES